ncbi:MAG: hypothetical protein ACTHZX_06625, partial [Microbacterium sp.]
MTHDQNETKAALMKNMTRGFVLASTGALVLALAASGSCDPLSADDEQLGASGSGDTIVVGSL